MKKLGIMFALAGVIAFGFSSCGGDDEEVAKPTPKFDFKTGGAYTSQSVTKPAGTLLTFGIDASGSEDLTSVGVRIKKSGGSETILPISSTGDSILAKKVKDFEMDFLYELGLIPGTESITVIVKMSNSTQTSKTINITVTAVPKALTEAANREMGAQSNPTYGSYFSMIDNSALLQADANAAPEDVDWIYYWGNSSSATIAAPDDAIFQTNPNVTGNNMLPSWSVKNQTRFKKLTGFDFAAATTSAEIDAELSGGTFSSTIADMKVGDVYLFRTEGDFEYGVIKITNLSVGPNSKLDFDMKFVSK